MIYVLKITKKKTNKIPVLIKEKKNTSKIVKDYKKNDNKKTSKNILVLPGTHDVRDIYNLFKNNKIKKLKQKIYYFKLHPKNKFKFIETKFLKKINIIKKNFYSNVMVSQTSTLVYDFLKSKKNFKLICCDYRPNLASSKINKKLEFLL